MKFKMHLLESASLINEFKVLIIIRLKMFKNKHSNASYKLPEWTKIIRIENIFRQLDKTSLFISQEPSIKSASDVVLFTLLNNPNSWLEFKHGKYKSLNEFYTLKRSNKEPMFHGAYMVNGPSKLILTNRETELMELITALMSEKMSIKDIHNKLLKINGLGNFMAHQIIINLQLKNLLPYDEDYVKLGPGSSTGLKILKLPLKTDSLKTLQSILKKDAQITKLIPKTLDKKAKPCELTLETVENCLCIFQKMKKMKDTGKTKRIYKINGNRSTNGFEPKQWYR